jgi:WD40 repeat protein
MGREAPHSMLEHVLRRSCRDLAARLRRGEPAGAEDYLARHPVLANDTEAAVELIYWEFLAREDLGQRPAVEEFLARFTPWRDRLQRQLAVHAVLSAPPGDLDEGADRRDGSGLEPSGIDGSGTLTPLLRRPGAYRIVREVGRGGSSVIFEAVQAGSGRRVALKCIDDGGRAAPEARRRLLAEARAAALLQHPNIVQVLDVGVQDDVPFLALEFVEGKSLARWLKDARPAPGRAARMVEVLARAVHYAHQRGVIHRDLSPGNVLLTADGTPKITDFGLALHPGRAARRQAGAVLGTPGYMAPEQAGGPEEAVTAAADVHALGAILYELLTGSAPFPNNLLRDDGLKRLLHEPPAPPRRRRRDVPAALEVICLKCLEKAPARRYDSAGAMADDLARFARGEAIRGRIGPWPLQAARRAGRHAGRWGAALALALLLALPLGLFAWWFRGVQQELATLRGHLEAGAPLARALGDAERRAEEATRAVRRNRYTLDLRRALEALTAGDRRLATDLLDGLRPAGDADGADLRGFEWYMLAARLNQPVAMLPPAHRAAVYAAAIAPDGTRFATGDLAGTIVVWDAATLRPVKVVPAHDAAVTHLRYTPDGTALVSACGEAHGRRRVALWDAANLRPMGDPVPLEGDVHQLDLALDGRTLVVREAHPADRARLWRVAPEGLYPLREELKARHAAIAPDGRRLAVAPATGPLAIGPLDGSAEPRPVPAVAGDGVQALAWRGDGAELAVVVSDGSVLRIDPDRGAVRSATQADGARVAHHLRYSPDGARLVAVDGRGLTVHDAGPGAPRRCELSGGGTWTWFAIAPDATAAMAGDAEGVVGRWNLVTGAATPVPRGGDATIRGGVFFPTGHRLVLGTEDGRPWYWAPLTSDRQDSAHTREAWCAAFAPSGRLAATGGDDNLVRLWTVAPRRLVAAGVRDWHTATVSSLAFSPRGDRLVTGDLAGGLALWNPHGGGPPVVLSAPCAGCQVRAVRIAGDGRTLATAWSDGVVRLWDLDDPSRPPRATATAHAGKARALAISPDGTRLASAGNDAALILWDLGPATPRELWRRPLPSEGVGLAYAPDGKALAVGLATGEIELRDPRAGGRRATLRGHGHEVHALTYTPDGETLLSGSLDGSVRAWDPVTGLERLPVRLHRAGVHAVAVSLDGTKALSCDHAGLVRLTLAPRDPAAVAPATSPGLPPAEPDADAEDAPASEGRAQRAPGPR